jgi:hypothetical protein
MDANSATIYCAGFVPSPDRPTARCRTDGDREVVQPVFNSRGVLHGMPLVPCRIGSASRSDRHRISRPTLEARQPTTGKPNDEKVGSMLYTIAVVLIVLWLLGLVTSYTLGGVIHILLVLAIIMILVNVISGRRAL